MSDVLSAKALNSLDRLETLPRGLRECVHEFGFPIVDVCLSYGISKPSSIRNLVREIWAGARQERQRGAVRDTLDWIILQNGGVPSARVLYRLLNDNNIALVPMEPTRAMLNASMEEVSGFNVRCSREEKHRRRLRAANRAEMNALITQKP